MGKIKVLQFPISNAKGGITQYALENWRYIDKDKFQFDFVTMSKELDFANQLLKEGCKIYYLSCYAEENEEQFIKEMNQIFDENYDVVHLHTSYWKSFLVEKIARERRVSKIIVHAHSTMIDIADEENRKVAIELHKEQKRLFSTDLATHFCACSEVAAEWLFGDQIPKEQIKILNNAIDTSRFSYNEDIRRKYREELGIEDCFVLGHVGRFVYQKNHELLIKIFKEICEEITNARLILVGDGPLMKASKDKVKEYKIDDKVLFMGIRTDVANLMQAMDVFLLPSRFEGLGLVLVEAQCAGLKCVASEYVPREAKLTSLLEYAPYNVKEWCKRAIMKDSNCTREMFFKEIEDKGYGLKNQIQIIEELYSEGMYKTHTY